MTSVRRRLVLLAFAFMVASGPLRPRVALAEPPSAEAQRQSRSSFEEAEAHFRAGLFAEALAEYQAGYDSAPLPGFLINIGQCHRRLGDLKRARANYRKFILVAPDSPLVPQVNTLIAELDKLAEDLDEGDSEPRSAAHGAPGAVPALKLDSVPRADPGAGASLVTAPAGASAPSERQHERKTRWWLWGGVGTAVAVAATAALFALRSPDTTTLHDGTLGTLRR